MDAVVAEQEKWHNRAALFSGRVMRRCEEKRRDERHDAAPNETEMFSKAIVVSFLFIFS